MNQEQLTSIIRQLLLVAGGSLITKGYVDADSWGLIAGGLATVIVGGGWALYSRRTKGLAAAAANAPGVQAVIADPKIAHSKATPGNVVTSAAEAARLPGVSH